MNIPNMKGTDSSEDPPTSGKYKRQRRTFDELCMDITQHSTLHGVNRITDRSNARPRRLLWLLLVLGGSACFLHQLVSSLVYYYERPIITNTRLEYKESITFPSVTICNQNFFRLTKLQEGGYIRQGDDSVMLELLSEERYENVTLLEIVNSTGHSKDDMVLECSFNDSPCNPEDIETFVEVTERCFTFNPDKRNPIRSRPTGTKNGLHLQLNIEQYEYIPFAFEHLAPAGIMLRVHDGDESPNARISGMAISPGAHAFVSVKASDVRNLPPPYGKCGNKTALNFHQHYTMDNCFNDFILTAMMKLCDCQLPHRESVESDFNNLRQCTFTDWLLCQFTINLYFWAYQNSLNGIEEDQMCDCPVACKSSNYDATISYASVSQIIKDSSRNETENSPYDFERKLARAQQARHRIDSDIVAWDQELVIRMLELANRCRVNLQRLRSVLERINSEIGNISENTTKRTTTHKQTMINLRNGLQYEVLEGFDAMVQTHFQPLTTSFKAILRTLKRTLTKIIQMPPEEKKEMREVLHFQLEERLEAINDLTSEAKERLQVITKAMGEGREVINYPMFFPRRYQNLTIPTGLMQTQQGVHKRYSIYFVRFLDTFPSRLDALRNISDQAFRQNVFNATVFEAVSATCLKALDEIVLSLSSYRSWVVQKPRDEMDRKIMSFGNAYETFLKCEREVDYIMRQWDSLIRAITEDAFPGLDRIVNMSRDYIVLNTPNKVVLAKEMTSREITRKMDYIDLLITDVRSRTQQFRHRFERFEIAYTGIWESMITESTTRPYYTALYKDLQIVMANESAPEASDIMDDFELFSDPSLNVSDLFLLTNADLSEYNVSKFVSQIHEDFENIRLGVFSSGGDLYYSNEQLLDALAKWRESLTEFLASTRVDQNFYRQNILEVEVDMSHSLSVTEQKIAYDNTKLWSDIGGSLGLFVGASVLTLFEMLDAIVVNFLKHRRQKSVSEGDTVDGKDQGGPVTTLVDSSVCVNPQRTTKVQTRV